VLLQLEATLYRASNCRQVPNLTLSRNLFGLTLPFLPLSVPLSAVCLSSLRRVDSQPWL